METLEAIADRRSVNRLDPPAPTETDLETILGSAAAAPDHCELRPWRFVILEGPDKDRFGDVLAESYVVRSGAGNPPTDGQLERERHKLDRAPLVLVVAASPEEHPNVPAIEQVCSAAAAAQNALLAATALGYGSMWRTGNAARDTLVAEALGLGPAAVIVGFLYLGTKPEGWTTEPRQPMPEGLVSRWHAPAGVVSGHGGPAR